MSCEDLAGLAGFAYPVGNWIAPNGDLILADSPETDHCETLSSYLDHSDLGDNKISWTNSKVEEGYIRLVFRHDIMVQVNCVKKEELWDEKPNLKMLMEILSRLSSAEVHLFSKKFYLVSSADNIIGRNFDRMVISEKT